MIKIISQVTGSIGKRNLKKKKKFQYFSILIKD
jgi:hypothetical protein